MGGRGKIASHLLGVVVFITCLAVPVVAQDTVTITISRIAGTIELNHPQETDGRWITAHEGQKVGSGWELRTGSASKAELLLPRENTVILRENSVLYIDWLLLSGGARLRTDNGGLLVDIKQGLSPGSEFEVQAPSALAVVRGTKFGVVCLQGGATAFYGYRGKVEVSNDQGREFLTGGRTVDAKSGMAPSAPMPSGPDAEAFLAACEAQQGYAVRPGPSSAVMSELGQLDRGLDEAASRLAQYEADWERYSQQDKQARLVYTYSTARSLRYSVDQQGAKFQSLLGRTNAKNLWQRAATVDTRQTTIGNYAASLQQKFGSLYERFESLERNAQPVLSGNQELLTTVAKVSKDQTLPAWPLVDTDTDGVSDVDEVALGLDSKTNNSAAGFIALSGPEDKGRLEFPQTMAVTFEYTPLKTKLVTRYRLVLEAGGRIWQRTNVGPATKVQLAPLLEPEGMFAGVAGPDGEVKFSWYVAAELDAEQLLHSISARAPDCAGLTGPALASAKRTLRVALPQQSAVVMLDLSALDRTRVHVGEKLLVEGRISEVNALGKWRVDVACDPALMQFVTGSRGTLGKGGMVYFAEPKNGVLTVTGTSSREGPGISRAGTLFQLEFKACEPGKLDLLVQALELHDILGREIEANPGHKVSAEVLPARAGTIAGRAPRISKQRGKY